LATIYVEVGHNSGNIEDRIGTANIVGTCVSANVSLFSLS